jgi:ABC-type Mn2+/Zn2+ transport system permease subunit
VHADSNQGEEDMNGWSIIFAVTSTVSGLWGSSAQSAAAVFASVLFGFLFLLALCTKAVRGKVC